MKASIIMQQNGMTWRAPDWTSSFRLLYWWSSHQLLSSFSSLHTSCCQYLWTIFSSQQLFFLRSRNHGAYWVFPFSFFIVFRYFRAWSFQRTSQATGTTGHFIEILPSRWSLEYCSWQNSSTSLNNAPPYRSWNLPSH